MQKRDEIDRQFVFRMGELHIVFAFLKCIGKFIGNSGLDEIFVESGIYGPQTLEQIKSGKHLKRSFEAYLTLYIALYELYLEKRQLKKRQLFRTSLNRSRTISRRNNRVDILFLPEILCHHVV